MYNSYNRLTVIEVCAAGDIVILGESEGPVSARVKVLVSSEQLVRVDG